jgi:hypothetical protein
MILEPDEQLVSNTIFKISHFDHKAFSIVILLIETGINQACESVFIIYGSEPDLAFP